MIHQNVIEDIAIIIILGWVMAIIANAFKQPLILAYLITGFAIGPMGYKWVDGAQVDIIAELGLILLLFMIGLEIDLKKIISAGRMITLTGASQILGGFLLGLGCIYGVGLFINLSWMTVLYFSVTAALSSTVIVVKLLYDKRELDTLPGRVTLGILVLQDLFAIVFLAIQPQLSHPEVLPILLSLGKVVLLVLAAFAASRFALPPIFRTVARLPELVLVGSLAWCFMVISLGQLLGLSKEMGALIAGVAISTYPYTLDVTAKVTTLRDFFLTLFFVALGMKIPAPTVTFIIGAVLLSLFLVGSRFITVFIPLYKMRQGIRASFLPALNLSQMSEFSLVILVLGAGKEYKHVDAVAYGIIAYTFVFMAVLSTYGIVRSDSLSWRVINLFKRFSIKDIDDTKSKSSAETAEQTPGIFMLGFSWTASSLLEEISHSEPSLMRNMRIIDFNPNVHHELRRRGIDAVYGDITQRHTLEHAGIGHASIILCTLPNIILKGSSNVRMTRQLRDLNPKAVLIVHAELISEVAELYQAGANYVCLSRVVEATQWFTLLRAAQNNMLESMKKELDLNLKGRNEVIP